jgi:hypothetical protein
MPVTKKLAIAATAAAGGLAALLLVPGQWVLSADHLDPPARTDPSVDPTPDIPADIADIYTWYDANNLYLAMTFAGPAAPGQPAYYDRDVLYTMNISTAPPASSAEIPIRWRFGPATNGTGFGIRVENLPGVTGGVIQGPVEQVLSQDGVQVYAGLRDDPFFFDLQGFRTTLATGTLSFDRTRNFFFGKNDTAVVISIPRSRFTTNKIDVWGTTARFGGQL